MNDVSERDVPINGKDYTPDFTILGISRKKIKAKTVFDTVSIFDRYTIS